MQARQVIKAKPSVKELGRILPDHIRLLSSLIARKPKAYTPEWASTIDEAFRLYTRTNTVNLLDSLNRGLIDLDWPFPAYVDLSRELAKLHKEVQSLRRWRWLALPGLILRGPSLTLITFGAGIAQAGNPVKGQAAADVGMVFTFRRHRKQIFVYLAALKVLTAKRHILADVQKAFHRKMWAACITTAVPLLDFVMRTFFETERLNVTLQVLRDAFIREANLRPKDLMPGSAFWDGRRDPAEGNTFAQSLEEDLRLPGIYLSSFFEFADWYYEWYKSSTSKPRTPLNRHAVMHCASEFSSEANAVRIVTFLDLMVRLENVLKVLIHGESAVAALKNVGCCNRDSADG